jgi:hypothetical protein
MQQIWVSLMLLLHWRFWRTTVQLTSAQCATGAPTYQVGTGVRKEMSSHPHERKSADSCCYV